VTSAQIFAALVDPTNPAGSPLVLAGCDASFCGDPTLGAGANECTPWCN
jgi:hypothetical protein